MKYLSFDPGFSHTGVAISYEGKIATGLTTIDTGDYNALIRKIIDLLAVEKPDVIIIGTPDSGPVTKLANDLKEDLETRLKISPLLINEDFTTRTAKLALIQSGASQKSRFTKQHQAAAAALLQSHLDTL